MMSQTETLANLSGDMLVCDLFASIPAAREVFLKHGYKGCGGPTGPAKPIAAFSQNHGVPLEQLLEEVRQAATSDPVQ